jgi:hypothetical protein
MPTTNQLVRNEREKQTKKAATPALLGGVVELLSNIGQGEHDGSRDVVGVGEVRGRANREQALV